MQFPISSRTRFRSHGSDRKILPLTARRRDILLCQVGLLILDTYPLAAAALYKFLKKKFLTRLW
jgi:hypothetical protein